MAENSSSLHVVMFPWLAFGHIIPFLELSKFIAKRGHKITFASTPKTIDRLPKFPPNLASSISFLSLTLPRVKGLPEAVEVTADLGPDVDVALLKKAHDGLEPELTRFLENSLPDWIVYDFAPYWLPPTATKLGISTAFFSIYTASSLVFFGPSDMMINGTDHRTKAEDFTVPPPWVPFETKVAYKLHECNWTLVTKNQDASGVSDMYRVGYSIKGAAFCLVRQCKEFEGQWLELLAEQQKKPMIPVGLMPPQMEENSHGDNEKWVLIKEWLDEQERASVVYVAFGTEVSMSQLQLSELALGLELSGIPFFWVLRKRTDRIELPDGFEERVQGRGIVWKSWAPQLNILNHESVGGFLTHCGWSSVIEGLMFGHPLIMLPFVTDTGLVARVLEEKQVGMEIPRNEQDRSFTRDSVADSLRMVITENGEKIYRNKSKEIGEIFGNRELQDGYIHELINLLEDHRNKPK